MTAATDIRPWRIPVRTPLEKAVLAATFARTAEIALQELGTADPGEDVLAEIWAGGEDIFGSDCVDEYIDRWLEVSRTFRIADHLLRELRRLTPGSDAAIGVPNEYGILEQLDKTVEGLAETKVEELVSPGATQRQVAAATIAAIDLQEDIAKLQDAGDA